MEEDLKFIRQLMLEILNRFDIQNRQLNHSKWLNINELCEYLPDKPSINTIYKWVSKNRIPFHKIPGHKRLRFLKEEIDHFIESGNYSNGQVFTTNQKFNRKGLKNNNKVSKLSFF